MDSERIRILEEELRGTVRGEVDFDPVTRGIYSTDASIYQMRPLGVVSPRDAADVASVIAIAAREGIAVLPRGGGTSLSGQTVTTGLVLDFTRHMQGILEIDVERRLVRVQPGVVLEQLNGALRPYGLQFGPDVSTSSRATLGGMIGNNSAGSRSVTFGKTIDHVRELRVLLSDGTELRCGPCSQEELSVKASEKSREGEIYRRLKTLIDSEREEIVARFPKLVRRVSGYNLDAFVPGFSELLPCPVGVKELDRAFADRSEWNLARMIVGAEGTLGTVVEATLHVVPLPKERGVACLQFESIDAAVGVVPTILEFEPSAVELLDRAIVELSRENLHYRHFLDFVEGAPAALLIVEFSGDDAGRIRESFQRLEQRLAGAAGLQKVLHATTVEQREQIWRCREAGAPLLLSIPGGRKPIPFVEDTAVSPAKLPEFTKRFRRILDRNGVQGAYYGHASVGCLHIRPLIDTKVAEDRARLRKISDEVTQLVLEFEGALSGEHGDGLARSIHNRELFGERLYETFREVKRLFDPAGIMNPGKIVEASGPTEHLRYGEEYRPLPIVTVLDFEPEARQMGNPGQGFLAGAEMCNGSGVCRKTHTGTMCPSFMATGDEIHSPRGRANALRMALSGQLEAGALTSERMYEVLDLCLQCKGCKAECPSNVDVAKLKVEFLGHYHRERRPAMGTVMQGHVAWLNRIGSATAPLSNWMSQLPGVRSVIQRLLGIDQRRSLPRFARESFQGWFQGRGEKKVGVRGTVVLLDDCLTSYCEPGVNRAAVELLEAAGYEVKLAGLWCCGRPLISKGLLDGARSLIQRNLVVLNEYVLKGWPILGTEPSCLLTLVDEYPDFFPQGEVQALKRNAFLIEEWIAERAKVGEFPVEFSALEQTALLHGHCQQKALVGTRGTRGALGLIPGLQVQEVDSGCCGMAGSFGYEHYEISQQIGERVLFPAVRGHEQGPVVAGGFSCRHQVGEGCGRGVVHPVEVLRGQMIARG